MAKDILWDKDNAVRSSTMIGDVNLFLKGVPSDDDFEVEAEIMIAGKTV